MWCLLEINQRCKNREEEAIRRLQRMLPFEPENPIPFRGGGGVIRSLSTGSLVGGDREWGKKLKNVFFNHKALLILSDWLSGTLLEQIF